MGETTLGNGREPARQFLEQNKDIAKKLEKEILVIALPA